MKEKFLKIQFLVYAVLLFVAGLMLESYLGETNDEINIPHIEKVLHEKESYVEQVMDDIMNEVNSGERIVRGDSIFQIDRDFSKLKDEGVFVYVFENGADLRYWTDNIVSPEKLIKDRNQCLNIILQLDNAWYDVRSKKDGNFLYVGLILLKYKYKFTNDILHNDFQNDFVIDGSMTLAKTPVCGGMDVKNKDNAYIFSVVPSSNVNIDGAKYNIVYFPILLSLIFILMYIDTLVKKLVTRPDSNMYIISIILGIIFLRIITFIFQVPQVVYMIDFFDPETFKGQGLFATFGDFIFNIVILFFLVRYLFCLLDYNHIREKIMRLGRLPRYAVWGGILLLFLIGFGYLYSLTHLLVSKCGFSLMFNDLKSLSIYSFSGILIFLILNALVIYVALKVTSYFDSSVIGNLSRTSFLYCVASFALALVLWMVFDGLVASATLFALLMVGTAMVMHSRSGVNSLYTYIFMLVWCALFSSVIICDATQAKNLNDCHNNVINSSGMGDPIAELMLSDVAEELPDDDDIKSILFKGDSISRYNDLYAHIHRHYCNGYLGHYNMSLDVVQLREGQFLSQVDNMFMREFDHGTDFGNDLFRFVENHDGTIGYYAPVKFSKDSRIFYLFVSLNSNPAPNKLGYPSILLEASKLTRIDSIDYAVYHNGRKVSNKGFFNYDMSDRVFIEGFEKAHGNDSIREMEFDGCIHSVYRSGENTFVLSKKCVSSWDFVIQFAYMFVIFVVALLLFLIVRMLASGSIRKESKQIKTKLIASFSIILFSSFVVICACMVMYNIHRYHQQDNDYIEEKLNGVYMRMVQDCSDTARFSLEWNEERHNAMNDYVRDMSHVFFTDINLYGPDGKLIACSRPEVFNQGLVGTRMNCSALKSFMVDSKSSLIQNETINKMRYVAAYMPFYNSEDSLIAYINLAYFNKFEDFEKEQWMQIVSVVNIYMVILMIAIFLLVFVSDGIVRPIKMIQDKMVTMELGKNHEKIDYTNDDEIGQLVAEYNSMVDKLADSAKKLAEGERDQAWKTMARQVAHEIKNPLTPMKLNVQFITRAWSQKAPDFEERLTKTSDILIQQIDTLSSIATSFSNFAKMKPPELRPLNIIEILGNVVILYKNTENVDVTSDFGGHNEVMCMLDNEQITRVFVNIIKNATQAIPDGVRGKIHVSTVLDADKITINIADNGTGIPDEIRDKLFTPNFTTKSAGSGLGLAMVKTMVENAKGTITFESEVGKGTTFIITLPVGVHEVDEPAVRQ